MTRQASAVMVSAAVLCLVALGPAGGIARADVQPFVCWPLIEVSTERWQTWVDRPGGDQWSVWKWSPCIDFIVQGPIADGCKLFCDWFMPDGKPWVRTTFRTSALGEGDFVRQRTQREGMDKFAITQTGVFPFKIGFTRPGQEDAILFRGRAKINRIHVGNDLPKFKDQFAYYADQDWKLPLAYLRWPTTHLSATNDIVPLDVSDLHLVCWFAQSAQALQGIEAHVYCGDREIVLPELHKPMCNDLEVFMPDDRERGVYTRLDWDLVGVVAMEKDPTVVREPRQYVLAKHPGEHEIRLIWHGQVVRKVRFTVGPDGKIVDNTSAWKNTLGTSWLPVPVTVSGSADRPWDKQAWKTGAFWGNPLPGFAAP
jgi:hypothetical protein